MPSREQVRRWSDDAADGVFLSRERHGERYEEMADMLADAAALLEWTDDGGQHCDSWREAVAKWVRQWRGEEATDD